jgi:cell division protein FtsZ
MMAGMVTSPNVREERVRIKVVGAGGGGGSAVHRMISAAPGGVELIAVDTDVRALERRDVGVKLIIGQQVTDGLGCGGDWVKGRAAADESRDRLGEVVGGADLVFVTAGMGGGTGTGSAPIIAEVAKAAAALTIGVVTRPFRWEGRVRGQTAELGIEALRGAADALIVISNDRLGRLAGPGSTLDRAFRIGDEVLQQGVRGIADLIVNPGVINLDLADVRAIVTDAGEALMGIGHGAGERRAEDAARQALSSPLLETSIEGAENVLFNITAAAVTLPECEGAAQIIREAAHPDANIIFGVIEDARLRDEAWITVVATRRAAAESGSRRVRHPWSTSQHVVPDVPPLLVWRPAAMT